MRLQSAVLAAVSIGLLGLPLVAASRDTGVESSRTAGYDENPGLDPWSGDDIDIYRQLSFEQYDVNQDGYVNPSEFLSGNPGIKGVLNDFVRLDASNDGALTRNEFRSAGLDTGPAPEGADAALHRDPNVPDNDYVGTTERSFETQAHRDLLDALELERLDGNRDGIVTQSEFAASVESEFSDTIFTRLDINKDGRITRNELETAALATGMAGQSIQGEQR